MADNHHALKSMLWAFKEHFIGGTKIIFFLLFSQQIKKK
jgi:hypothetical protein